jgi:hypothetical protein
VSGVFTGGDGEIIERREHNGKNEEILDAIKKGKLRAPANTAASQDAAASQGGSGLLRSDRAATPPTVNVSQKTFWVQRNTFYTVVATLRAAGEHSNVWVADKNYDNRSSKTNDNKIAQKHASELARKFDQIYKYETPIFGFEYGGDITNTSDTKYGGADGDPKIQILVYDIDGDYKSTQTGGTFGYFFIGDEYSQSDLDSVFGTGMKTNQAEIFYVDAHFTDYAPDTMYSTLAHEFQHMINFNEKTRKSNSSSVSGVWYNEMLSLLAEDLIAPLIGIQMGATGHPVNTRIPDFLQYYYFDDFTKWLSGSSVSHSYANAYAFGAYLVRNFGGVDFIRKVMSDIKVDTDSLDAALANDANPLKDSVSNFNTALTRYGEAMLFNQDMAYRNRPPGVLSFNSTVTKNIDGTDYTFSGFDIWNIAWKTSEKTDHYGPFVYNTNTKYSLKPRTMLLQSNSDWQDVRGDLEITIQAPSAPGVELYVMVR